MVLYFSQDINKALNILNIMADVGGRLWTANWRFHGGNRGSNPRGDANYFL
jgi:hypothetical protein